MPDMLMPRLSDSMEEGTIVRWLKADGDEVSRGEEIVEIETDKATMSYEADASGRLLILASEGTTLPVGAAIARIGAEDRAPVTAVSAAASEPQTARPAARDGTGNGVRRRGGASPVARRLAAELGVALESVHGSGPYGRILKADVAAVTTGSCASAVLDEARPAEPRPVAVPEASQTLGEVEVHELSRTQVSIARRMAASRATVPDFELRSKIEMDACLALRAQLTERRSGTVTPSLNDFLVKACGLALREHPRVNGSYRDGRFELHERVNVGIAVAAEDALLVPTIFDADSKSLGMIAAASRELIQRARNHSITPPELAGGTFTVSNLGPFGIPGFSAVINPPQAAILAIGSVVPSPVVRDGAIVVRSVMEVALACDHRILYGADGARFLARVRELLEDPLALVL